MSDKPSDWGSLDNPRKKLRSLRDPTSGDSELFFTATYLDDSRRNTIYNAMIGMAEQADNRHLERARLAYRILKGENVDEEKLRGYGIQDLEYTDYFRVIASNFYSALTHLTEVLLELRHRPEGAIAGTLELLADGQKINERESLENVLKKVDDVAGIAFDYETQLFGRKDFVSSVLSNGYCDRKKIFAFQEPVEEINIHPHWKTGENFYPHHKGQWEEVNIAREQFEPECKKLGIELGKYTNILKLYKRLEKLDNIG